ncbi:MAG: ComEC/Rec2 family competence protein [Bacteroidales bacterium]|nr:ComEC/Rec2 family competence protein [Bacteroidales bacterium]
MLYKETPFTGYCIALVAGIICSKYMHSVLYCNAIIGALSIILIFNFVLYKQSRSSVLHGILFHCCIFFLGSSVSILQTKKLNFMVPVRQEFVLRTDDYPEPASRSLMLNTSIIRAGGNNNHTNNKLLLYTDELYLSSSLEPGSIIRLASRPVEITDFDSSDSFDYRLFMNRRGFRYCIFCYDSISVIGERPGPRHLGLRLRRFLLNRLENTLPDKKTLSVVSAMTLGYRELLDNEIKEEFRKSGIIHIMAVSGLHVGIISMIIVYFLKITRIRSGTLRLLISLLLIWTYALLTGLSPSVTRASVMFSFLNTGYLINRPVKPLNSVMASAFLILIANPHMLYEPSFLLSYSAVIAIVANYRNLLAKISFRGLLMGSIWKIMTISILAQAGTIPFVALFFGEIPILSVLSNLFAIPLATIILFAGFTLIFLAGLPLFPEVLNSLLFSCVNTLSDAAATIASWDRVVITADGLSASRAVVLFFLLIILVRFLLDREKDNPHILLTITILYFIIP